MRQRYVIHLRLDPESPLLIGTNQTVGNYRRSGQIIPGRTWRGALAQTLRQESESLFEAIFEQPPERQAHFGPLFPARDDFSRPYPNTVQSCKHYPGLNPRTNQQDEDHHGVFDTLIRQYVFGIVSVPSRVELPIIIDELRCPVCNAPAEPYSGFADSANARIRLKLASTTHVAINRRRRVAEDSLLYVREAVQLESQANFFAGWVDIPEEGELIHQMKQVLHNQRHLRIGANRSRGMGHASVVKFEPLAKASELREQMEERLRIFNDVLDTEFAFYTAQTGIEYPEAAQAFNDTRFFTLDLRSPAIVLNKGIPGSKPELKDYGIDAEIIQQWVGWQTVGGWNAAARLPMRSQAAISGVFLCRFNGIPDWEALCHLELDGIGERREQGFGQLTVCDPIHNATV